jgi:predicted GNAT superfamily acetyltransferase
MPAWKLGDRLQMHILESVDEMIAVENLQRQVWPGNETDVIPAHMLLAASHNGGLTIGVFDSGEKLSDAARSSFDSPTDPQLPDGELIGFVFGFPGLYDTPDGPRPKHCSHMLGVLPAYRDQGVGFALKRAQWQMVRHQGLDRITWTYDPLLSRNAHLNIARLGAVCSTYLREEYGEMRDGLNMGLPSDRFQVDWWVNSQRVTHRLSKRPRRKLDLANFLAAETAILNPTTIDPRGYPIPLHERSAEEGLNQVRSSIVLIEIPADFMDLKSIDHDLALEWRLHTRQWFEALFNKGYLVTDFVHLPGAYARSFYVLSNGMSTL